VSLNRPLAPLLPLPPSIHPSPLPKSLHMHFPTIPHLYTPISFLSALHLYLNCIPPLPYLLALHFTFLNYLWQLSCYQNLSPPFFHTTTSFPDPQSPTPAWPIPSPCPHLLPTPPFHFSNHLWTFLEVDLYSIPCIHVHTLLLSLNIEDLTAFFGCSKLPGKGECTAIYGENQVPKKRPNIHIAPSIHTQCIPYSKCAVRGPCGAPMQPQ